MGDWNHYQLKDIAYVNMGQSPAGSSVNENEDGAAFLQGNADFGEYHPCEQFWCSSPKKIAQKDDIMISVRAPVGAVNVADKNYCIGRGLASITFKICKAFALYALTYEVPQLHKKSQGSTFLAVNKKDIEEMLLNCPTDLLEQEKISRILQTLDSSIIKTKAIIEKYQSIKEGLLQDLLVNGIDENGVIRSPKTHKYKDSPLGKIPVEWECVELTEWSTKHSDSIVDGPFGSNLKLVHYRSSGIPVIQSGYVTSGHFVANNYVYVDMEKFREQYRCRVNPKDIVMAKIGANCGRSAVLPENHPQSIIAGNSLKITVNKQYVPELLHEFLEYYYAQGKFELIKAVTAQPAISLSNLKKMKIVLMSAPEQKRIWEKIDAINKMIMEEKNIYHKLLSTKTGLMQDLLTHKVPVDPLLERSVENE